jgi:hypothetical protein
MIAKTVHARRTFIPAVAFLEGEFSVFSFLFSVPALLTDRRPRLTTEN